MNKPSKRKDVRFVEASERDLKDGTFMAQDLRRRVSCIRHCRTVDVDDDQHHRGADFSTQGIP